MARCNDGAGQHEGWDFVKRLCGMFLVAVWAAQRRQLVLARDRVGKNLSCLRRESHRILFSSEVKIHYRGR